MTRRPVRLLPLATLLLAMLLAPGPIAAAEPSGYEHLHTYAEVKAEIDAAVAAHPGIARRFSIGQSYEGRKIWAIKISDNVDIDEDEPEVLFNALIHARERLSNEMAMHIIATLTNGYGTDQRITDIVNSREIWVIPMLNPDGAEYDISNGAFHTWRKNRQPVPDSTEIGIDLNRQFGFNWACCGGSSANPPSATYRGPSAWYAPEVRAYRDFIDGRVIDGRQQIRAIISWHSAGRMVLWPYAYTRADVPSTMSRDDWRAFVALGRQMAATNGYRAQQGSDLYIVDGDQDDWAYNEHRIFAYTFEMAKGALKRYYPSAAEVAAELANNTEAVLPLPRAGRLPVPRRRPGGAQLRPAVRRLRDRPRLDLQRRRANRRLAARRAPSQLYRRRREAARQRAQRPGRPGHRCTGRERRQRQRRRWADLGPLAPDRPRRRPLDGQLPLHLRPRRGREQRRLPAPIGRPRVDHHSALDDAGQGRRTQRALADQGLQPLRLRRPADPAAVRGGRR